ncbi:hypothetical protein MES4922_180022 [Mesorhizobium ventifaucium]|uniref:Uncharacterized protein n=1 Tax=Mesorhizobium ventifaucium TaxID=666020 RepID=A0ABN8JHQ9_9HYPH|nr:hypothetical protein MES4922_180022 [Mesorhizobium ventifaucium]
MQDRLDHRRQCPPSDLVSIGGTYYILYRSRSHPTVVEVHQLAARIRILDEGPLVASHPHLEGRRR